ncbi:ATP-binding cassette domain-containing protein [Curtobacterium sp. RRHDQ10]|uniref:ABC transporter ATP-binding protein n=1 Tax=Curtobacterium phyllosphaerae TaxID=3413379 RepID=UPI003BF1FC8B
MSVLEVSGVQRRLGRKNVLRDVSFGVRAGEVVGLLGENGAGKSTLLRVVCGIDRPDQGTVRILSERPTVGMRHVGAMLDPRWIDGRLSCTAHVRIALASYGLPVTRSRVRHALADVGLADSSTVRAGRLSLGMRQRLALGVATLHSPGLLVLDEPINGLDPGGVLWIRDLVQQFARSGGAVLLSSHLMSEMERVADRVVILSDGVIRSGDDDTAWGRVVGVVAVTQGRPEPLLASVLAMGGAGTIAPDGALHLTGVTPADVFAAAMRAGAVLVRLDAEQSSLEDFYQSTVRRAG